MNRITIAIGIIALSMSATAQEKWSLEKCIDYAVEHNINIKQQQVTIEQSEIELNTAKMDYLPSVSASGSQSWSFGRGLTSNNTYSNTNTSRTSYDVSANMTLFSGFSQQNTVKSRTFSLKQAMADLTRAKEDISVSVASAYLQVLYSKELVEVSKRQVELSRQQLAQRQKMALNGKASESDIAEVRAQVAQDELSVVQTDNDYQLALLELSQILELPTLDGFDVEEPDTTTQLMGISSVGEVYGDALENRAVIQSDNYKIEKSKVDIDLAKAGHMPTLSLMTGLGSSYYNTSGMNAGSFGKQMKNNFNKSVILSLNVPIFNKFSTRNNVKQAQLNLTSQQLQLEQDKKSLYKEIQQAYYSALAAQSKYGSSMLAEESAETSFRLMTRKYDNGKATQTEYNQSRTQWLKTVADRIQAKYEYMFRSKILEFYRGQQQ